MEQQVIIDCSTGLVSVEPDTFLAVKPVTIVSPTPVTSVIPGSGTGSGATVLLHQSDPATSTDIRGVIDITVGASPIADSNGHYPLAVITFGTPYPIKPLGAMIDRVGANAVSLGLIFSDQLATAGFSIIAQSAPIAGQTYRISYALG